MLELVPYIHRELGYEIAIPNGAMIDEEISATNFGRLSSAGHLLLGVSVVVSTDVLEREAASPEEFLQQLGNADKVIEVVADNGNLVGAGVIVEEDGRFGSAVCETTIAQFMVFIVGEQAYSVFIQADAPDRCDVTLLPETAKIINSFRVLQGASSDSSSETSN